MRRYGWLALTGAVAVALWLWPESEPVATVRLLARGLCGGDLPRADPVARSLNDPLEVVWGAELRRTLSREEAIDELLALRATYPDCDLQLGGLDMTRRGNGARVVVDAVWSPAGAVDLHSRAYRARLDFERVEGRYSLQRFWLKALRSGPPEARP